MDGKEWLSNFAHRFVQPGVKVGQVELAGVEVAESLSFFSPTLDLVYTQSLKLY